MTSGTGVAELLWNGLRAWRFSGNPSISMIPIPRDFLDFLRLLSAHKVKHLLIGGYAVAYYGYVRATGDLDIFVEASEINAERLVLACREFGLGDAVTKGLFLEEGNIIRFGSPPMRLEILNEISGVSFQDCWDGRNQFEIDGLEIPLIGSRELIQNKRSSGRAKDLVDAEMLSGSSDK